MDVFGHDNVSNQAERIPDSDFAQFAHKTIATRRRSKQRAASETTEGDEVEIALSVAAL